MKLIIAVIQDKDVPKLMDALVRAGYSATKLASTGGFLREGNSTIFIGVDDDEIENVLEIVKDNCRAREQLVTPITPVGPAESYVPYPVGVMVGGATVFILPIERFVKV
ncbi:MAG TPA: cyclic-di-AMP receptor [Bacillota bacterium]|nr:cyclic-di-AMP receptor [Bacillota bacterium]HPT35967.1 cyclic-di-AMP receptor [Bacillota bacterium]